MSVPVTTSDQWKSASMIPADTMAVARWRYGDGTKVMSLAERDITIGGENFLGILNKIPIVGYGASLRTSEYSIVNTKVDISNLEYEPGKRFSDLFTELGSGADIGFENRQLEIRIWKKGITTFEDCFPLFPGGIARKPISGRQILSQDSEDQTEVNVRKIYTTVVEQSDATSGYALPTESVGTTKPQIYGDHIYTINSNNTNGQLASDWVGSRASVLTPMRNLGGNRYLVADHELSAFPVDEGTSPDGTAFWAWDPKIKRFIECRTWTRIQNTSAGAIVQIDTPGEYFDYRLPTGATARGGGTDWVNPERLYDRSIATAAVPNVFGVDTYEVDIDFPTNTIVTADVTAVKLFIKGDFDTLPDGALYVDDNASLNFPNDSLTTAFHTHNGLIPFASIDQVPLTFQMFSGAPSANVYEVYMRVSITNTDDLQLFSGVKGRPYGTWIDNRAVGDGYTETHADNGNSGLLIENPAGVQESVFRDGMALGNSDIDRDSLNIASNLVSSLKTSFSVSSPTESKRIISGMSNQFRSFVRYQPDVTFAMDVLKDTYTTQDRIIRYADILKLDFPETDYDLQRTKVRVLYDWDGNNLQSATDYSEAATSQTKYNVTGDQTEFSLQAPFIHDPATAEAMRDFFLAQWKNIHNIAVVTVPAIHRDLDFGSIVRLDDVPYEANGIDLSGNQTLAGQTIYNRWFIYNIQGDDTLTFKAIQLHDLTT